MKDRTSRKWLVSLSVTLGMLALLWAIGSAMAQEPEPEGDIPLPADVSVAAIISSTISYQGVLKENGVPVTGNRDMTFRFYADACSFFAVGSEIIKSGVPITNGLFSVELGVAQSDFNGQGLWLEVLVGGTPIACQQVLPVPYALSLRPGAVIKGEAAGASFGEAVLNVESVAASWLSYPALYVRTVTGSAVRGESTGVGLHGESTWTYAVEGTSITGTAGYFSSQEGYGIRADTSGTDHWDHGGYLSADWGNGLYAESAQNYAVRGKGDIIGGLYGESNTGIGVTGESDSGTGVYGSNNTTGSAVHGSSLDGYGVYGYSEDGLAVYGSDGGVTQAKGYGGYFTSNTGVGVYGYSSAQSVVANAYTPGVYGRSANGVGVYGLSNSNSNYGGLFHGGRGISARSTGSSAQLGYAGRFYSQNYRGIYVESGASWYDAVFNGSVGITVTDDIRAGGDIFAGGSKAGYVVDIALNDGPDPLELGDVVVVTGSADPVLGRIPVPRVQRATSASSTAVIGVVDRLFVTRSGDVGVQEAASESPGHFVDDMVSVAENGGVAPGQYVGVVTLGSFRAIKVDASYRAIRPGDLLVSSPNPGYAMRAEDPRLGTVIGKALDPLDGGTGVIPVLVMLQ